MRNGKCHFHYAALIIHFGSDSVGRKKVQRRIRLCCCKGHSISLFFVSIACSNLCLRANFFCLFGYLGNCCLFFGICFCFYKKTIPAKRETVFIACLLDIACLIDLNAHLLEVSVFVAFLPSAVSKQHRILRAFGFALCNNDVMCLFLWVIRVRKKAPALRNRKGIGRSSVFIAKHRLRTVIIRTAHIVAFGLNRKALAYFYDRLFSGGFI